MPNSEAERAVVAQREVLHRLIGLHQHLAAHFIFGPSVFSGIHLLAVSAALKVETLRLWWYQAKV